MPNACLKIDITIIILVKAVIPKTRDGKIVNAVINTKIFRESEYVLSPLADSVIVSASNPPPWNCWEKPTKEKSIRKKKN